MKGFSFDSFVVHETNKAAYDVCAKLAALDKDLPRPIVLLGESGSGKSHLLWSIVNHYREKNAKVGVALISSKDFPNKVKALPDNPEKLQKKFPVVLMVDELHLFDKDVAELERVILAFQEHNQIVIVASNIHPSILPGLSGRLKSYLGGGAIVGIKPLPKAAGAPIPEAAIQQITALKARVAELEAAQSGKPAAAPDTAAAGKELEALRAQLQKVTHERDSARAALERSEGEAMDLRDQVALLRQSATGEEADINPIIERLEKQKAALTERIAQLEDQLDQLIIFSDDEPKSAGLNLDNTASQLSAAEEESELLRILDGIRETLREFDEVVPAEAAPAAPGEGQGKAKKMLATIVEQLRALEAKPAPKPSSADAGQTEEKAEDSGAEADTPAETSDEDNAAEEDSASFDDADSASSGEAENADGEKQEGNE